jgi:hypothetical protein
MCTHLVNFERDEYNSRVAKTVKENQELVKASFEHATEEYTDQAKCSGNTSDYTPSPKNTQLSNKAHRNSIQ